MTMTEQSADDRPPQDRPGHPDYQPAGPYEPYYTEADLLDPISEFVDEHDRPPLPIEYERRTDISRSTVSHRFGSYSDAVRAAGFEPIHEDKPPTGPLSGQWVPADELIDEIHVATALLGKPPSSEYLSSFSEHSYDTFLRRFGSIDAAHEAAGVTDYDPLDPPDPVREYQTLMETDSTEDDGGSP
jgi:hypothetical protein